jgi:anthranilate synthase component 1
LRHTLQIISRTGENESEQDALKKIGGLENLLSYDLHCSAMNFRSGARASNFSSADFCRSVESLKSHIRSGDIFQAVLSQRFSREFSGDPFLLYRALRRVNPSPYMFYHETPAGTFVGASPELLIGVEKPFVQLLPIAGTRPRGESETEDKRLEKELLADTKEKAEHMMLVDLGRNDLGRVSEPGTVVVNDLASVHRFSHVMHMVSRVSGKLSAGKTAADAFNAAFPAGTVSGAPKVRALELIFEHEPTPRGAYAGAAGFLGFDGNAEFCITLRTAVARDGLLTYQAGAGIVADSVPEKEFAETIHKAGAIESAIAMAGEWT